MTRAERRHRACKKMAKRIKMRIDWCYFLNESLSWITRHSLATKKPKSIREALENAPYMAAYKKTFTKYKHPEVLELNKNVG